MIGSMLRKLYTNALVRYLTIASGIVIGELIVFQWFYVSVWRSYFMATVVSFALAVVVNWFLSRKVVFGASAHHPAKEFLYVTIASVVGLAVQLLVVYICVNSLHLYPLLGKVVSIGASFFWNYWFRSAIVFKHKPMPIESVEVE